jgi:Tfp pilus assembly protein PilF
MKYEPCYFDYSIVGVDISQKKLKKIIAEIDRTVYPKDDVKQLFEAYLTKGICLQKLGKYDKSKKWIRKALKRKDKLLGAGYEKKHISAAYIRMGNVYDEKKEYAKALINYKQGLKNYGPYVYGTCMMGQLYSHEGHYKKAIRIFSDVISNATTDKERILAYMLRGQSYYTQGNYNKSISDYEKIIRLNPRVFEAYYNMGNAFAAQEKFDNALNNYVLSSYYNITDGTNEKIEIHNDIDIFANWDTYKKKMGAFPDCFKNFINLLIKDDIDRGNEGIDRNYYQNYKCLLGALYPLWHLSFVEPSESIYDDPRVYHYMSLEVLGKLLETKSLVLRPAGYQNDPKEGKAFFEKLSDYIPDYIIDKNKREKLYDQLRKLENKSIEDTLTYIYCFSENVDYTPMWNSSYGYNGKGCTIGIDRAKINNTKLVNSVRKGVKNQNLAQLYKIIYVNNGKERAGSKHSGEKDKLTVSFLLKNVAKYLFSVFDGIDNTDKIITALSKLFCQIAHLVKYNDWEIEKEYRLVYTDVSPPDNIQIKSNDFKKGVYIETIPILFSQVQSIREDKIFLGPRVEDREYLRIKHHIEKYKNYTASIEKSKVSYR